MDITELEFLKNVGLTVVDTIAKGGYGTIYLVHSDKYRSDFALKKVPESMFNDSEIQCLKSLYDPNIR